MAKFSLFPLASTLTLATALSVACSSGPSVIDGDSTIPDTSEGGANDGSGGGTGGGLDIPGTGGTGATPNGTGGKTSNGSMCGNGELDDEEECDDGNGKPADGCTGVCTVEPGYACDVPGDPCELAAECGDGLIEIGEQCDLGDVMPGDGCDDGCLVEQGWTCNASGCVEQETAVCGDGSIGFGEQCDDGEPTPESGDGCSETCTVENGYICELPGEPCVPIVTEYCGNGVLVNGEECDDGNGDPGDGCSPTCEIESGYQCDTANEPCTVECGDSLVIGAEGCDDGNTDDGDGCSADCSTVEGGYVCPIAAGVGGKCQLADPGATCPNAILEFGETCDDGNANDGDGCTDCTVDTGYVCPTAGAPCELIPFCGDGFVDIKLGEACDDHDNVPGDGCSATCTVEPNYRCPTPVLQNGKYVGGDCAAIVCGDGAQQGGEQCDDHNQSSNDGCSAACTVEDGWVCPVNASCQAAACGDGIVAGIEECDYGTAKNDGTTKQPDGVICAPSCTFVADPDLCGNGFADPGESCEDGNNVPWDECSPTCVPEPTCPKSGGACTSQCGDGMILPGDAEACDDGNARDGDGCDHTCQVEFGFSCGPSADPLPATWDVPVVYRDFNRKVLADSTGVQHADFETFGGNDRTAGMVAARLDAVDGKPVHTGICDKDNQIGPCPHGNQTTTKANFDQWYRSTPGVNHQLVTTMTLTKQADDSYSFTPAQLFPVNDFGFVVPRGGEDKAQEEASNGNNFGFTTELRAWFKYNGGERLDFSGDDDVWVFINGQLALDLGGLHPKRTGYVILGDGTLGSDHACETIKLEQPDPDENVTTCRDLDLEVGKVYEIALFHAERHTGESNFNLTLRGFLKTQSECTTACGDGKKASIEQCDYGDTCADGSSCVSGHCENGLPCNDGTYGGCTKGPNKVTGCKLAPFCGDGEVAQGQEECDNGLNDSVYSNIPEAGCSSGCKTAPYCGDGQIAVGFEQCDGGDDCLGTCQLEAICGDATKDPDEACDDGALNGTVASECDTQCNIKCGNQSIDPGEQCDPGLGNFSSNYGGCLPKVGDQKGCLLGPRCGDGIKNGSEACDDGKNDGTYGTCAPMCALPPRCGDGVQQAPAGELCDKGDANIVAVYEANGAGKCTKACRPVGYCGDAAVTNGETCDDGKNDGTPGSCTTDCSAWVPLSNCGNGTPDTGEECDDGAAKNGTLQSTCDAQCRIRCGNGIKDTYASEQCDDGVNNGAYGTCKSNCQLAPYCGDGTKDAPEGCDKGNANEANPYGAGKCTTTCQPAPYCGDGRIDAARDEVCDSTPGCSVACKLIDIH